jgi:valyl-tRNA synthetase
MKVGRRLAIKLLNASKFVLSRPDPVGPVTHLLDKGLLTSLRGLIEETTRALEDYDYARALQITETFFWSLCDNYLEMAKSRRYGDHGPEAAGSANASLRCALSIVNRLFAPYLPFAAEEVWSWWQPGSVHTAAWPTVGEIDAAAGPDPQAQRALEAAIDVLGEIRRVKSIEKRPFKARIETAEVRWHADALRWLQEAEIDVSTAGGVDRFVYVEGDGHLSMSLTFAPDASTAGDARG